MPVPPAPTVLALLPVLLLIAAAELARARHTRPEPDVYEPGDQLSPAEVADIEAAGFEPVYLPADPAPAKARVAVRSTALDDQLHRVDRLDRHLATVSPPNTHRAALAVPAPASPRKEPTAP